MRKPARDRWSCRFDEVLNEELNRFDEEPADSDAADPVRQRAHHARLAGIAFSGGGIRSATFNLGVLQALADLKLLRRFDYLSTVSGGGYIGSWLIAWIHRRGGKLDEVAQALQTSWKEQLDGRAPEEVRFLRRFSNYLTPKLGWLGADTWTVIAIYLRNVFLNLATLVAGIAFVLMLPRAIGIIMGAKLVGASGPFYLSVAVFLLLLAIAAATVVLNLVLLQRRQGDLWSGEWLNAREPSVTTLIDQEASARTNEGNQILPAERKRQVRDFVIDLAFTIPSDDASTTILLRSAQTEGELASGWEIKLGCGVTGNIGEQKARTGGLPNGGAEVNKPYRLRVTCVGQSCSVRLGEKLINVSHLGRDVPRQGFIRFLQDRDKKPVAVTELLLRRLPDQEGVSSQGAIQAAVVLPLFLAGLILMRLIGQPAPLSRLFGFTDSWWTTLLNSQVAVWAIIGGLTAFCSATVEHFMTPKLYRPSGAFPGKAFGRLIAGATGGAVGGCVFTFFNRILPAIHHYWPRLVWGPPLFVVGVSIALILYLGLLGHSLMDPLREWWSRVGAWLFIYSLLWIGLFAVAIYGPPVLTWLAIHLRVGLAALSLGWVVTTLSGLFASKSAKTGKGSSSRWLGILTTVAPYVFIVGLLIGLSWGINGILSPSGSPAPAVPAVVSPFGVKVEVEGKQASPVDVSISPRATAIPSWQEIKGKHWRALARAHPGVSFHDIMGWVRPQPGQEKTAPLAAGNLRLLALLLGSLSIACLLGWRIDINEFSMHMMYRNRLARCYLGASNAGLRRPHVFTGFDQNDDIPLASLASADWKDPMSGPYPIVNCSLNLVGGHELAWQQRKAASFVFTPCFCGYDFADLPPGYCSTTASDEGLPAYAASRGPLTLATAMAISGAAASPNMGYHSAPATAFLMTLFNIRLGWWIGNPRHEKGWLRSSPGWALGRLVAEMFGLTNAGGRYVYLSDGGHFENLGIFELVRRRCRFIMVCDAEEDGDFAFEGLGNAIEKCRTDLGVDIDLDVRSIRERNEKGHSQAHCAVGRIHYDETDTNAHAGIILYLKSSLTGDEPTDVLHYAARTPVFPHETTLDQWFGESQFEGYRALGYHAAMTTFLRVADKEKLAGLTTERIFVNLGQRWYPPSPGAAEVFRRRGETLHSLYETLRTDSTLRFLSQQIYAGWRGLVKDVAEAPTPTRPPGPWLPPTYEEMRAGFYFCNRLISLMEDVYHDLHLEQEHSHPDNRGWLNLFNHWAWSRMFRTTWSVTAANCGARFQNFCNRHLGLTVGRIEVSEQDLKAILSASEQPDNSPLTFVEWNLVRSFFTKEQADLKDAATLHIVAVRPGEAKEVMADPDNKEPGFAVGFAILAPPAEGELARRILYFRIRNHMRRLGMARRALFKLFEQEEKRIAGTGKFEDSKRLLRLDPRKIPADERLQEDDDELHAQFRDLYRGVRVEFEQELKRAAQAKQSGANNPA